jgi:hypothetical protein
MFPTLAHTHTFLLSSERETRLYAESLRRFFCCYTDELREIKLYSHYFLYSKLAALQRIHYWAVVECQQRPWLVITKITAYFGSNQIP